MDGINLKDARFPVKNPRSNFDLSFKRYFDHKFGELYPAVCIPVMPTDSFEVSVDWLMRMAPFVSQVYQDYKVAWDFFFVPNRITWSSWSNFMTGGYSGTKQYLLPTISMTELRSYTAASQIYSTLLDAFDIPSDFVYHSGTKVDADGNYIFDEISALPFYAYAKIVLDWYIGTDTELAKMAEDYLNTNTLANNSGVQTQRVMTLLAQLRTGNPSFSPQFDGSESLEQFFRLCSRLYPLDYFTQARTSPSLGPVMQIPLQLTDVSDGARSFKLIGSGHDPDSPLYLLTNNDGSAFITDAGGTNKVALNGSVYQNTANIFDLATAERVSELLALYNYSGFMPEDVIAAEFDTKSRDLRSRRSIPLFHQTFDYSVGEVFSNNVNLGGQGVSGLDTDDMPGVGTAIGRDSGSSHSFYFNSGEDYGYLIGMCSVYPEASYSQGIPRHFLDLDRFDFPHPKLANLGMQSTYYAEIKCQESNNDTYDNDDTFNYNPRYSHYKVGINRRNGALNENLIYLNAGRLFTKQPPFNDNFLRVLPSENGLNRTFNVDSNLPYDKPLFFASNFNIKANRALPYFGLPQF